MAGMVLFCPQPSWRILVVDDRRTFTAFEATYARSSAAATQALDRMLADGPIDAIVWDHDLGVVDGKLDDTRTLALRLAELASDGTPVDARLMAVVTSNPAGRDWLLGTLGHWYPAEGIVDIDFGVRHG